MKMIEQIEQDIKTAMKEKNADVIRTLRLAMSSIKYVEKEKQEKLDDLGLVAVLQKEIKIRQETIEEAKKGGRQDLVDENEAEIKVLEKYLPAPLSAEELDTLVKKILVQTGAQTMKEMGKVMSLAIEEVNGRAPNNVVSQAIRKYLAG